MASASSRTERHGHLYFNNLATERTRDTKSGGRERCSSVCIAASPKDPRLLIIIMYVPSTTTYPYRAYHGRTTYCRYVPNYSPAVYRNYQYLLLLESHCLVRVIGVRLRVAVWLAWPGQVEAEHLLPGERHKPLLHLVAEL